MKPIERLQTRHLAACLSAAIALTAPLSAAASIRFVVSCLDDYTAGTLRSVIEGAGDHDIIDLHSQLPVSCSTITLQNGEVGIPPAAINLVIEGPSDRTLTIEGGLKSRILNQSSSGRLDVNHLTLSGGKYLTDTGDAKGGCIRSSGSVYLTASVVTGCVTTAKAKNAAKVSEGAGIYAAGKVQLHDSLITGNSALAHYDNLAGGGGVEARIFQSYHSIISSNVATGIGNGSANGDGGGVEVTEDVLISYSTIESNQGDFGTAITQNGQSGADPSGNSVVINNSTISGNTATLRAAAIFCVSPLTISNSTIAFNSANAYAGIFSAANVTATSSIIARNSTPSGVFADLYIFGMNVISGSNNVIVSSNLGLPAGTITSDPQLAPLAYHGGATRTHALLATSPAVDHGSNGSGYESDQRSTGFARELPSGKPDIGAYERQTNDDEIFYSGAD